MEWDERYAEWNETLMEHIRLFKVIDETEKWQNDLAQKKSALRSLHFDLSLYIMLSNWANLG